MEGADLIGGSGSDQIRVASGGRLVHTVVAGGSGEQYSCNAMHNCCEQHFTNINIISLAVNLHVRTC